MRQLLYLPFTMYGIDVYINMQKDQTIELIDGSIKLQYCTPLILGYADISVAGFCPQKGILRGYDRISWDKMLCQ